MNAWLLLTLIIHIFKEWAYITAKFYSLVDHLGNFLHLFPSFSSGLGLSSVFDSLSLCSNLADLECSSEYTTAGFFGRWLSTHCTYERIFPPISWLCSFSTNKGHRTFSMIKVVFEAAFVDWAIIKSQLSFSVIFSIYEVTSVVITASKSLGTVTILLVVLPVAMVIIATSILHLTLSVKLVVFEESSVAITTREVIFSISIPLVVYEMASITFASGMCVRSISNLLSVCKAASIDAAIFICKFGNLLNFHSSGFLVIISVTY